MVERQEASTIYRDVIREIRHRGIEFAIGGGMAVAAYTVHRQATKDIDLYVLPEDRDRVIRILGEFGLTDYYDVLPYDRFWIYRSHRDDIIVDVMWAMPNRRAMVDRAWLTRGPEVEMFGERVRVLPAEELIWAKLYVMQHDRCDWPDVLNLLYATGEKLDWDHLLIRLDDDAPLLDAVLTLFHWLCPDRARAVPAEVRDALKERRHRPAPGTERERLLDTRPWFVPAIEAAVQKG